MPWPTREVPTSFLLQFKRPPTCPPRRNVSDCRRNRAHGEISFVDMNNIAGPRRDIIGKWNSLARDTPVLCSPINFKNLISRTDLRRALSGTRTEERRDTLRSSILRAVPYLPAHIYFVRIAGESATETRVSRTMKKVENNGCRKPLILRESRDWIGHRKRGCSLARE